MEQIGTGKFRTGRGAPEVIDGLAVPRRQAPALDGLTRSVAIVWQYRGSDDRVDGGLRRADAADHHPVRPDRAAPHRRTHRRGREGIGSVAGTSASASAGEILALVRSGRDEARQLVLAHRASGAAGPRRPSRVGRGAGEAWTEAENRRLLLELIADGRLEVERLVTDIVSPAEAPAAFDALADHSARHLGVAVDWSRR